MRKALVIEDDDNIRSNLQDLLQEEGFEVLTAVDGKPGISLATRHRPSVIICDILLPEVDGYTVLGAVRADPNTCSIPFLFLTAKAEKNDMRVGMNLGADDYVTKPFSNADLVAAVRARIDRAEKLAAARRSSPDDEPPSVPTAKPVVHDPAMREVYDQVDKVAREDISVLVLGENGVGKEVIARALHARSPRAAKSFVALNCAALPESLLEAELFGHEKGAFTDAKQDKKGLFEAADGGTLFLDEIGELPTPTQVKLLRVLQEKEVMRIGARAPTRLDVRFLAATNRDLEEAIARGSFREDLYYRIATFVITVPPLRERTREVVPLAESFMADACRVSGRAVPRFSRAATDLLTSHPWPGNVRELKNAVQRALVLCGPGPIEPEHLGLKQPRNRVIHEAPTPIHSREALRAQQDALERQLYIDALEKTGGNQTRAAELVGVSRRTFVTRMGELNLPRPRKP